MLSMSDARPLAATPSTVLWRDLYRGRPRGVMPHWLLDERDGLIVSCIVPGVQGVNWSGIGMSSPQWMQHLMSMTWQVGPARWEAKRVVRMARTGEAYAVNLEWDQATGNFVRWYANLQAPYQRSRLSDGTVVVDTYDHILDVLVDPDLHAELKDDAELTEAVRVGLFTPSEAAAIRAASERVIANLGTLLSTGWEDWKPDPSWPLPTLPDSWNRL